MEKAPSNKTPAPKKLGIWAFESLVHQISSLQEVLELKQNFQKES